MDVVGLLAGSRRRRSLGLLLGASLWPLLLPFLGRRRDLREARWLLLPSGSLAHVVRTTLGIEVLVRPPLPQPAADAARGGVVAVAGARRRHGRRHGEIGAAHGGTQVRPLLEVAEGAAHCTELVVVEVEQPLAEALNGPLAPRHYYQLLPPETGSTPSVKAKGRTAGQALPQQLGREPPMRSESKQRGYVGGACGVGEGG